MELFQNAYQQIERTSESQKCLVLRTHRVVRPLKTTIYKQPQTTPLSLRYMWITHGSITYLGHTHQKGSFKRIKCRLPQKCLYLLACHNMISLGILDGTVVNTKHTTHWGIAVNLGYIIVLAHFDPTLEIGISCDACNIEIGSIPFYRYEDGSESSIANI